jgi:hypothetical protein
MAQGWTVVNKVLNLRVNKRQGISGLVKDNQFSEIEISTPQS